jgi:SpoVK/Ycf46/Vps4 family AAA+-type ATPase
VEMKDFDEAHKRVGASIVRGSAAEVPEVSWHDIGGPDEVKVQFHAIRESPAKE